MAETNIVTLGTTVSITVTLSVVDSHPVFESLKVKVTSPEDIPVTSPVLVTVALVISLDDHVPPLVGDKLVVFPTHIEVAPVIPTIGLRFTVTITVFESVHVFSSVTVTV